MGVVLLAPAIIELAHTHEAGVLRRVWLLHNCRSTPIVVVRRLPTLFEVDLLILLILARFFTT